MGINRYEDFKNIFAHGSFKKEFLETFKRNEKSIQKEKIWLNKNLEILDQHIDCNLTCDNFCKLKGTGKFDVYKIKHNNHFNVRYLYFIVANEDIAILLTAFRETNKSDYDINIRKAIDRIKQIQEDL